MNLAKHVSWDTITAVVAGLLFGVSAGMYFNSFTVGCWVFTGVQYLMYSFVYMLRIDRNLKHLLLLSTTHADVKALFEEMKKMQKEAERNAERRP